jgi:hypothetical protein
MGDAAVTFAPAGQLLDGYHIYFSLMALVIVSTMIPASLVQPPARHVAA